MDLLQLRYFQTVAETQNITKAAKILFISQPALSAAISRLEKDIGVTLFARASNRITLTEAGRCFLGYVGSAFSMLDEGMEQAKQIANRSRRQLRVASAFGVLRDVTAVYAAGHPGHEVEPLTCDTDEIRHMLASGEADLGLNLGPIADSRFTNRVLLESRFFIAVSQDNPIAGQVSVTLKELEGQLLFCSNIAQTYERAQEIFRSAGCRCNLLKLDEKDVLFEAARKGLGCVFCMPMISEREGLPSGSEEIVFIPIRDCLEKGEVVLTMRKDAYLSTEAERYVSYLVKCFYSIEEYTRKVLIDRNIDPDGRGQ